MSSYQKFGQLWRGLEKNCYVVLGGLFVDGFLEKRVIVFDWNGMLRLQLAIIHPNEKLL